ncbi:conserved hypothetical protein [Tenacibaculum sp. 190524A05c]|uniref:hypothetical protein n=1 Tax=Tenacibaculum platacis TaxID=3137852 RepID=UPI0031FAC0F0
MKKTILQLGKALKKADQQNIQGGNFLPITKCNSSSFKICTGDHFSCPEGEECVSGGSSTASGGGSSATWDTHDVCMCTVNHFAFD